jgi:hypothetical protein
MELSKNGWTRRALELSVKGYEDSLADCDKKAAYYREKIEELRAELETLPVADGDTIVAR